MPNKKHKRTLGPRYEFRIFGSDLDIYFKSLKDANDTKSNLPQIKLSLDTYIISKTTDELNIKIRAGLFDVKKLLEKYKDLEKWDSLVKFSFPINLNALKNALSSSFKSLLKGIEQEGVVLDQILTNAKASNNLIVAQVKKKRYAFNINSCICEFAEVLFGEKKYHTMAVEASNPENIIDTIDQLKINNHKNINYVKAIKMADGLYNSQFITNV